MHLYLTQCLSLLPMLLLTKPANQDRFNAAVVEVISLNVLGSVGIPGLWDTDNTLQYIERKTKDPVTQFNCPQHGTRFHTRNKCIYFTDAGILIQPLRQQTAMYE